MKNTRTADLVVGAGFVLAGIVVILLSGDLQKVPRGIGPAGYPRVISYLMIAMGLAQCVRSLYNGMPQFSMAFDRAGAAKILAVIVAAFAYVGLLNIVGFPFLTPFLLFVLMYLFGYRKYRTAIISSVCVSFCVWVVFSKIFMIFLPACSLF